MTGIMDHKKVLPRHVVCAALRNCQGQIICGARHYDHVMRIQIANSKGRRYWRTFVKIFGRIVWRCPPVQQGFIDQWGYFMDREEALDVATAANQIVRRCGGDDKELFSDNLY